MTDKKQMVSYWTDVQEVYKNKQDFTVIVGLYDNNNYCLGVHWSDYPNSRGYLTPCVIPKDVANAMLSGLIVEAQKTGDNQTLENLQKAYRLIN